MVPNILSLSRRHVLGSLYDRCEPIEGTIPVYLDGETPTLLGHVDESLGKYVDALSFHLDPDSCKKLSGGQFGCTVNYRPTDPKAKGSRGRITLSSITLVGRETWKKPITKTVELSAPEQDRAVVETASRSKTI
jgi:hypothetical protein